MRVERNDLPFTRRYEIGQILRMPIAHAEGNYTDSTSGIESLEAEGQVVLRYVDKEAQRDDDANVNGSVNSIAGICNPSGTVMAMMPHPERCAEEMLSNSDGLSIFSGVVEMVSEPMRASL